MAIYMPNDPLAYPNFTVVDRSAIIEAVVIPPDEFYERLAKVYRHLENYLLTQQEPSPKMETESEKEGVA